MATYWTVLIIFYSTGINGLGINGDGNLQTHILFPSMKACSIGMRAIVPEIQATWSQTDAICDQTKSLSSSPRPKPRPTWLVEGE